MNDYSKDAKKYCIYSLIFALLSLAFLLINIFYVAPQVDTLEDNVQYVVVTEEHQDNQEIGHIYAA